MRWLAVALYVALTVVITLIADQRKGKLSFLPTLRQCAPYTPGTTPDSLTFTYATACDSAMTCVRSFFKLDSIAGDGDDVARMKRIMAWLHDNIRHDGWNGLPKGVPRNSIDLYRACADGSRGLNCRGLAIVLSEMYMAMGWPARFVTCQPKEFATDPDCHVICMVWSPGLGRWLWMDPTFAAYVMDGEGRPIGIREARERLRDGLPLSINGDANWNNLKKETKEEYLDVYMAKNLYYIGAYLDNGFGTDRSDPEPPFYNLSPAGAGIDSHDYINTHDDEWFWQSPR